MLDSAETIYWNPKNNPASWRHMVNFTVGLGLGDFLAAAGLVWNGDMYGGSYPLLKLGSKAGGLDWPRATEQMGQAGSADYGKERSRPLACGHQQPLAASSAPIRPTPCNTRSRSCCP